MSERDEEKVVYFAEYDFRGRNRKFGIKAKDRTKHFYAIGKTGMGKTVMLINMAIQDIQNGNAFAFIDPHGEAADSLLDHVPENRVSDVIYFAPFDMNFPISFNVMEDVGYDKRHLVVNNLMSAFKKIWVDVWSSRMEYILQNVLLALLEYPDSTLLSVNRMLIDKEFRKKVLEHVTDPVVKSFWTDEFAKYTDRYTQEATPAIQNKIGQFVSNPLIRNIVGQPKSSFDMREVMDNRKILIINLSKGRMGELNARLLGSMLIIKIYLAAMSRADVSTAQLRELPNFYLYVDEFQSFANETFADILSESRKYKLNLTIAHQYIGQMVHEVRDAIFGNVGTMVTFRIGAEDAEVLEKEFVPVFTQEDMVNIGAYQIYLKLMIDGLASKPFSARTLPPYPLPPVSFRNEIIESSRSTFAKPRTQVEESIKKWHEPITAPPATSSADQGQKYGAGNFQHSGQTQNQRREVVRMPARQSRSGGGVHPGKREPEAYPPYRPRWSGQQRQQHRDAGSRPMRRERQENRGERFDRRDSRHLDGSFHRGNISPKGGSSFGGKALENQKQKGSGPQNANSSELRKALSEAINSEEKNTKPDSPVRPSREDAKSRNSSDKTSGAEQKQPSVSEIPEDELRKILSVEEGSDKKGKRG